MKIDIDNYLFTITDYKTSRVLIKLDGYWELKHLLDKILTPSQSVIAGEYSRVFTLSKKKQIILAEELKKLNLKKS